MRLFFTVVILFFSSSLKSFATFSFNKNCEDAYNNIISLRFEEGRKILKKEKLVNPKNDIPYYLENYIDCLTLFIGENENDFKQLKQNKDERLKRIEKGDKQSPFYLFTQAEIYLQWAVVRMKFKEYASAAYDIHKAYQLLQENTEKFPSFKASQKSLGLLHAIIGAIPEEYQWLVSIIGMKGTIQQGVDELNEVINSCKNTEYNYLKTESIIILAFVQLNFQKNKEDAWKLLSQINNHSYNTNPMLCFVYADIANHVGKTDEAISILLNKPNGNEYYPFYFLDYLLGVTKLNRLDKDADLYLQKYLSSFMGKNYIKAAEQKLAWYYLLNGNKDKYKECMASCKIKGNNFIDEDKQAMKEAETQEVPNIILLKARLLCDGGYYQKALAQFQNTSLNDFPTLRDQFEVTYRVARIYHELGMTDNAINFYQETLKNAYRSPYYFAANAALQLGLIYEEKKDYDKARFYFEKCLSLRNHEYQNSLDQKAKAGLNRLGGK